MIIGGGGGVCVCVCVCPSLPHVNVCQPGPDWGDPPCLPGVLPSTGECPLMLIVCVASVWVVRGGTKGWTREFQLVTTPRKQKEKKKQKTQFFLL